MLTARIDEAATPGLQQSRMRLSHPSVSSHPFLPVAPVTCIVFAELVICHPLFGAWTDEDAERDCCSFLCDGKV